MAARKLASADEIDVDKLTEHHEEGNQDENSPCYVPRSEAAA